MDKELIKEIQRKAGAVADGIIGDKTIRAVADYMGISAPSAQLDKLPTQAEIRTNKSIFGRAGDESNLENIVPPYTLYYDGKPVKTIRVHRLIAQRVKDALAEILKEYGEENIKKYGLDRYSGSFNYRKTTTGASMSMHAWGIALDFDAENNTFEMKSPRASLSRPECETWWKIWEKYGAVSLGRERNQDWMHIQFARL